MSFEKYVIIIVMYINTSDHNVELNNRLIIIVVRALTINGNTIVVENYRYNTSTNRN